LSTTSSAIRQWLNEEFPGALSAAFEAMAGAKPEVQLEAGSPPSLGAIIWHQSFAGLAGRTWISASEQDWMAAGSEVMRAAGIEDSDPGTLKSTYFETIGQALSLLASVIASRLRHEVSTSGAEEGGVPSAALSWAKVRLVFPETKIRLEFAFEQDMLDQIARENPAPDSGASGEEPSSGHREHGESGSASKTFDLLLDVELPVSVSFGRAQVLLKDLIKLTTGSIVELNRSIAEPVEVIVNNCVIARGEVVVVEGNFGVRIQQVVSRQERLRTLN
jgi:flagellar motor switch protein FliN/FliY